MTPDISIFDKQEELDPELLPYLGKIDGLGQVIQSPLVFSVPHHPQMNAYVNLRLREVKKRAQDALDKNDWLGYVFWHEKPYRFEALAAIAHSMPDGPFWRLFGQVWTDAENTYQNLPWIIETLKSERACRELMMDEEDDLQVFEDLPDTSVVFRGHIKQNKNGLSWTLDKERAEWFGRRFSHNGQTFVTHGEIQKSKVIAYFGGRNESEIVCFPTDVMNKVTRKL